MSRKILFCTDFHLGARGRNPVMIDGLFNRAISVLNKANGAPVYMLGDLFDRHSNPEAVIEQGAYIVKRCAGVLEGNHDRRNIVGKLGSLQLIDALAGHETRVISSPELSEPYYKLETWGEDAIYFVPHCLTQELFVESVISARSHAALKGGKRILCLHCNVGEAYGKVEEEGSTLCLTDELQKRLLEVFDLILVGHEHTPRKLCNGRLVILGNLFPMHFGELADRYVWWLDLDSMELTPERIFSVDDEYLELCPEQLLSCEGKLPTERSLVQVVGKVKAEDYPALSRALHVFNQLNKATLYTCKNAVEIQHAQTAEAQPSDQFVPRTVRDLVAAAIKDTPFADEYDTLVKELGE